jgi:GNAT superfamily N-acetyltransferase
VAGAATVREATAADADVIARINVAAWRGSYREIVPGRVLDDLSVERRALILQALLAGGEHGAWIAEEDGEPVAYATAGPSRDPDAAAGTGELTSLYVLPARAGHGLGRLLLERVEEGLRARGHTRATLWVLEGNERARRFYELAGWAADGHARTLRWGPDELPVVRYARRLQKGRV